MQASRLVSQTADCLAHTLTTLTGHEFCGIWTLLGRLMHSQVIQSWASLQSESTWHSISVRDKNDSCTFVSDTLHRTLVSCFTKTESPGSSVTVVLFARPTLT